MPRMRRRSRLGAACRGVGVIEEMSRSSTTVRTCARLLGMRREQLAARNSTSVGADRLGLLSGLDGAGGARAAKAALISMQNAL